MKLIASGVANWAAIVRSPSFSRSSSSQTTTIRPRRISSIASSIDENARWISAGSSELSVTCSGICSFLRLKALHEPLHVAGDHVHLEVDLARPRPARRAWSARASPGSARPRSRPRRGRRREADAVDGRPSRARRRSGRARRGAATRSRRAKPSSLDRRDLAGPVDVARTRWPPSGSPARSARLEVDRRAGARAPRAWSATGSGSSRRPRRRRRDADATVRQAPLDRHRVARGELGGEPGPDPQARAVVAPLDLLDRSDLAHDAR